MKKVLVTGASGFVGKALLKELEKSGTTILALVHKRGEEWRDRKGCRIIPCEMEQMKDLAEMIPDRDIDTCIHLAWSGSTGEKKTDYKVQLSNVKHSLELIEALSAMGVKRFVGAGTVAERNILKYAPEDGAKPDGVSIYGTAKITAHYMTKTQCTKLGMEHVWCCLASIYGEGDRTENFIHSACRRFLRGERGSFTAGEQLCDFVYITDAAGGIRAAAENGRVNTSYYIGSGEPRMLKEYVRKIRNAVNPSAEIYLGEVAYHGKPLEEKDCDCGKLREDTGYEPKVSFGEGLLRTVEWLKREKG